MEFTNITQQGYALNIGGGVVKYRLETSVDTAGELPTTHIFVYNYTVEDTPASDTFERVASVADLTDLKTDRDTAIANGQTEYLSNYVEVQYDSLDVARQAKTMIASRINELIRTWITFRDEFEIDTDEIQFFPTSTTTEEEALKEAYKEAKDARIAKEAEVTAKEAEIVTAESEAEAATSIIQIYEDEKDFCEDILNGQFNEYVSKISVEGTTAGSYRTGTLVPSFNSFCAVASANYTTWINTKQARDQNVATLTTEKIALSAELVAAQEAEDAALAAVLAVCPDFDPASV